MFTLAPNDPVPVATKLVVPMLPTLALPDTDTLVNMPVLVIFGCAEVVTVPAVSAVDAYPAVSANPAESAYVAFATVPVTFAPATLFAVVA